MSPDDICGDQSPGMGSHGAIVYTCTLRPHRTGPHKCRDDLGHVEWGYTYADAEESAQDDG